VSEEKPGEITQLLVQWSNGDRGALDRLMLRVRHELHRIASNHLRRETPDHLLQPTALVHEAYLRLINQRRVSWQARAQFFAIAARLMRRVLVDHARERRAAKRGGEAIRVTLTQKLEPRTSPKIDVIALDEALGRLAGIDPRQEQLIELRFFGGLSFDEAAKILGISKATAKRDWITARAWLYRELSSQ
jgi:RNA polymerase sigma-70 factor (ECF subfamily)